MEYFEKITTRPEYADNMLWNIPEQPQGDLNIIGGNSNSFNTEIKIAEFLSKNYPIKNLKNILPDALKNKLPPLDNFLFLKSTDSGSFANEEELKIVLNSTDFNLILGDLSKNSVTLKAISGACVFAEKPTIITRDTIDLLASENPERLLINSNLIIFSTLPGLQKILHAVYYPKMLLLSSPLMQVAEILHKFTLSYPIRIITFHAGQILIAENGNVKSIPIELTSYNPLTLWLGEPAAKISALNLYNPNNFLEATTAAIF